MWRPATGDDDEAIVAMCLALNAEDPGQPVDAEQIRRSLAALREAPIRGRAVVAEVDGQRVGYALLISFWSNEWGGEICAVDELYVEPAHRGRGIGTSLFDAVVADRALWPTRPVAVELEVTGKNTRARELYERLGFRAGNVTLRRRIERLIANGLLLAVLLLAGCKSYTRIPVTPWLSEVSWVKESLIAESGRPRGTYLERVDASGDVVQLEGWGCTSMANGDAALCFVASSESSILLWRSGQQRTVDCGGSHFDERAQMTDMGPFATVTKANEREVFCVESYYAPVHVTVTTRQDLEGRELGRSEEPMQRAPPAE